MIAAVRTFRSRFKEKMMRNVFVIFLGFFFFLFVMSGVFADRAQAGKMVLGCSLSIDKVGSGEGDEVFTFFVDLLSGLDFELQVGFNDPNAFMILVGESAVVTELVPEGWELVEVGCVSLGGGLTLIVGEDNSVLASCASPGEGFCNFTNARTENVSGIPTLGEWGMIAAAGGLGLVGVFFAVRRRRLHTGA